MKCPRCKVDLNKHHLDAGFVYTCPSCDGRAVALPVVRKLVPESVVQDLWNKVNASENQKEINCPACNKGMANIFIPTTDKTTIIDVCRACHFVWFDPNEIESLPEAKPEESPTSPVNDLQMEAKKVLALARLDSLKREREFREMGISSPDHWWEIVFAVIGLPIEYNYSKLRQTPMATYLLAALIILATLFSYLDHNAVIAQFGLIPREFTRLFGLTLFSSFFLHGGILHLLGNLYFLLVFGDNVEDDLGRKKFLLLVLLAALFGDMAHILQDPNGSMPLIGASGGISGIIVYYWLRFPRVKLGVMFYFRWFRIPAGLMLFFWVILQVKGLFMQVTGQSNVSSLAHMGGALVGVLFWWGIKDPEIDKNEDSVTLRALTPSRKISEIDEISPT